MDVIEFWMNVSGGLENICDNLQVGNITVRPVYQPTNRVSMAVC